MAIKHQYTVFCHYVITSKENNLSFIDSFSNITFAELPSRLHFFVAVGFQVETCDKFSITVDGPTGKVIETLLDDTVGEDLGSPRFAERDWVKLGYFHQPMTHYLFESGGVYSVSLRHEK